MSLEFQKLADVSEYKEDFSNENEVDMPVSLLVTAQKVTYNETTGAKTYGEETVKKASGEEGYNFLKGLMGFGSAQYFPRVFMVNDSSSISSAPAATTYGKIYQACVDREPVIVIVRSGTEICTAYSVQAYTDGSSGANKLVIGYHKFGVSTDYAITVTITS